MAEDTISSSLTANKDSYVAWLRKASEIQIWVLVAKATKIHPQANNPASKTLLDIISNVNHTHKNKVDAIVGYMNDSNNQHRKLYEVLAKQIEKLSLQEKKIYLFSEKQFKNLKLAAADLSVLADEDKRKLFDHILKRYVIKKTTNIESASLCFKLCGNDTVANKWKAVLDYCSDSSNYHRELYSFIEYWFKNDLCEIIFEKLKPAIKCNAQAELFLSNHLSNKEDQVTALLEAHQHCLFAIKFAEKIEHSKLNYYRMVNRNIIVELLKRGVYDKSKHQQYLIDVNVSPLTCLKDENFNRDIKVGFLASAPSFFILAPLVISACALNSHSLHRYLEKNGILKHHKEIANMFEKLNAIAQHETEKEQFLDELTGEINIVRTQLIYNTEDQLLLFFHDLGNSPDAKWHKLLNYLTQPLPHNLGALANNGRTVFQVVWEKLGLGVDVDNSEIVMQALPDDGFLIDEDEERDDSSSEDHASGEILSNIELR
jgi:hypothetical protein